MAVLGNVAQQGVVSGGAWGLVHKLPSSVIQAVATASGASPAASAVIGATGWGIGGPAVGFAHRHIEAAVVRQRLKLATPVPVEGASGETRPSRFQGIDHNPSHPFHNKELGAENVFVAAFSVAGALKGIVKAAIPTMGPWATLGTNVALDVFTSTTAGAAAAGINIARNPDNKAMEYTKAKVAVPDDPIGRPYDTHLFDGETRNRMAAGARTIPWTALVDVMQAIPQFGNTSDEVTSAALGAKYASAAAAGAIKPGATLLQWFQGRRTEVGVRPTPAQTAQSGSTSAEPAEPFGIRHRRSGNSEPEREAMGVAQVRESTADASEAGPSTRRSSATGEVEASGELIPLKELSDRKLKDE